MRMQLRHTFLSAMFAIAGIAAMSAAARASIVVTITEDTVANTVTTAFAGSLVTTDPTFVDHGSFAVPAGSYMYGGGFRIAPGTPTIQYFTLTTPFVAGFTSLISYGSYVSDSVFGYDMNGGYDDQLYLPAGYVSGTSISGSAVYTGSFSSLSINTTPLSMSLPGSQTIQVNFATVPEPASLSMLGLGGLAMLRRRR